MLQLQEGQLLDADSTHAQDLPELKNGAATNQLGDSPAEAPVPAEAHVPASCGMAPALDAPLAQPASAAEPATSADPATTAADGDIALVTAQLMMSLSLPLLSVPLLLSFLSLRSLYLLLTALSSFSGLQL